MVNRRQTDQREQANRIASLAENDPQAAIGHLSDLPPLLVSNDIVTRKSASAALLHLSVAAPLELRSTSEAILARLDDSEPLIRANILYIVSNLATWYPQDFGDGTDLMVASLRSESKKERIAAATALTKIGYYRPDLVTPRTEVLTALREARERDNLDTDEDYYLESDILNGALQALEGGDMASRPLEDDLVPSGKRASLSKPARVGITALLWVPLAVASLFFLVVRPFTRPGPGRINRRTSIADFIAITLRTTIRYLKHLSLLYPTSRGRLYIRRSPIATPTRLVPWFAGTTPKKAKLNRETPPYPDDWATLATLVRQRDGHQCRNCDALGGPRQGNAELHVDHQNPRSRGGEDHPQNLRTLCRNCHEARHGRKFD
ncbi:HNH endonuclease signature motif containing protein [Natronorubrum thiooxidans]|uniref:HNH endonuclease n=1 Tax=Natronorubrum thiooxidans TaxID=308853 RepID=A0A1N7H7G0_9EURY|nr:HNH endonuclease [Natronorubrum thiooxidans]